MIPQSAEQVVSIAVLQAQVEQLRKEVTASTAATKELVDAWNAASGVVRFVKLLSTLIAALGVIYLSVSRAMGKHPWW